MKVRVGSGKGVFVLRVGREGVQRRTSRLGTGGEESGEEALGQRRREPLVVLGSTEVERLEREGHRAREQCAARMLGRGMGDAFASLPLGDGFGAVGTLEQRTRNAGVSSQVHFAFVAWMSVSAERDPVATVPLPTAHPYHSEPPQDARLLANDAVRAVRARRRLDDGPEDNPCSVMHDFCAEHCCTLCGTLNGRTVDFRRSTYRTCPASCASRPSRTAGGDQSRKTRKTSRMKKTPAPRSPAGILGPDWGCSLVTWTFILLPPILILGFGFVRAIARGLSERESVCVSRPRSLCRPPAPQGFFLERIHSGAHDHRVRRGEHHFRADGLQ